MRTPLRGILSPDFYIIIPYDIADVKTAYFDMPAAFGVNGCEVIKIKSSEIQFPDRYLGEAVLKVLLQQMVVAQKDPVYSEDLTMSGLIPFVSIG